MREASTAAGPQSHPGRAAFWMIGAIVSFSAMAVAGRKVSVDLDTFEVMTYRSAVSLLLVLLIGGAAGTLGQIRRHRLATHGVRNLAHFTGQNLWFYAITVIPLAQVFALEFTSPLWVLLFAALFLGERPTPVKGLAGLAGFIGILIVVQPGSAPLSPGMIAAAMAAICFAVTAIFTKSLTRTETITCILAYLAAMQLVFGLVACLIDGDMALPGLPIAPWVVLIGVAGLTAHFCMTKALSIAPASIVMPMDFIRLPAIALVGMALYAEPLDWAVIAGAALIFVANYVNILAETRRPPSQVK
ncbi:EamA family transporter [Rhodophyticola sp. CCM32]|uniref:DMT family transporter n=1 Tax=Rhodophyticola sp. CCM32 TaxID=2916397 RepID=UPI00107FC6B4|nr:DMT family transporter [Rhodophyticola sp. CCM32]QBY00347.1 EamA family transporter [Rhodophyticola sp. CCM32]